MDDGETGIGMRHAQRQMGVDGAEAARGGEALTHAGIVDAFVEQMVEIPVTGLLDQRADEATIGGERVAEVDELQPFARWGGRWKIMAGCC